MTPRPLLQHLRDFPWSSAARTLRERLREDRLGVTAGSLTFTTTIALVPFFTVVLAIFTAFPVFGKLQGALQAWLVQSLVPDQIARQVLGALTQFAGKASRLGAFGLVVLLMTALSLVLTVAFGCVIVMIMKGPQYTSDSYELQDADRPPRDER